jgi:hypothetical protein
MTSARDVPRTDPTGAGDCPEDSTIPALDVRADPHRVRVAHLDQGPQPRRPRLTRQG